MRRPTTVRRPTEAQFQEAVIETAHFLGWRVAHFRAARTAQGWRTPVQADGKGFPDLILVPGFERRRRPGFHQRVVAAELKVTGSPTPEQRCWLQDFKAAGAETYVWTPVDLVRGTVVEVLR